jgi:hypothetical protein
MKEVYEKPAMATEDVDIGALVASGGSLPPLNAVEHGLTCPPCNGDG